MEGFTHLFGRSFEASNRRSHQNIDGKLSEL